MTAPPPATTSILPRQQSHRQQKKKQKEKEKEKQMEMETETDQNRTEIVFFDVETTVPSSKGQGYSLLEFGAIMVCPRRLVELASFSTLVRPPPPPAPQISSASLRCNGITPESVAAAPPFSEIADQVYNLLHGRVWAGHNIVRFDCARIKEAFEELGRTAPEPKGTIDTLPLLTQRFGRRAGDMKMASLATYFGLGRQMHRSLDDVRLNLEVLKYCATVLFLESNLPDALLMTSSFCEATVRTYCDKEKSSPSGASPSLEFPYGSRLTSQQIEFLTESKTREEICDPAQPKITESNSHPDLTTHMEQMSIGQQGTDIESATKLNSLENIPGECSYSEFLEPGEIMVDCVRATVIACQNFERSVLLHKDVPLQIFCSGLRIKYGISMKYQDHAGRPKLSIVVHIPATLSNILDRCDDLAQRSLVNTGSTSQWMPAIKKNYLANSSNVRLHIPFATTGVDAIFLTDIYQREPTGNMKKLVFTKPDATELEELLVQGTVMDAYFSVDTYDYQQRAGLRFVAKRLVLHPT